MKLKVKIASLLVACCTWSVTQAQTVDVVHPPSHNYLDDDDQRRLADLTFEAVAGLHPSLRITVSAKGAEVESGGGYKGIAGENRHTAEELAFIIDDSNPLEVVTVTSDGKRFHGRLSASHYARVHERRLLPNGSLDYLSRTKREYPVQIEINARGVSSEPLTTYLVVDSQARLRCDYRLVDGQVLDLSIQSLGDDPFHLRRYPGLRLAGFRRYSPVIDDKLPDPVSMEEWNSRDREGKWVLMNNALVHDPSTLVAWTAFLNRNKEFALMEWLAIYHPDGFHSGGVGSLLAAADAPQWIRVAAWHCTGASRAGHGIQTANTLLYSQAPGVVERWLQTHRDQCDNWDLMQKVLDQLVRDRTPIAPATDRYLPPLQENDVYKYLNPPESIQDFGDATEATEGVVYEHQVIRAINAVSANGRRSDDVVGRVRMLTKHSREAIRIHALLAFSYYAPDFPGTEKFADFEAIIDDNGESDRIREAALMGWSYHKHPAVMLKLYDVAADHAHGAWKAAVSRLGDLGDDYSVKQLQDLDRTKLTDEQQQILANTLDRCRQRLIKRKAPLSTTMAKRIQLTVFAQMSGHSKADNLKAWVLESATRMDPKQVQRLVGLAWEKLPSVWFPDHASDPQQTYESLRDEVVQAAAGE